jgi:hypothetical protein
MEEHRKKTYQYLLYQAMLDIRNIEMFDFPCEPDKLRQVRLAGAIANWLHNLADFASRDFEGFNETWFWKEHEFYCSQFPEIASYRDLFEQTEVLPKSKRLIN